MVSAILMCCTDEPGPEPLGGTADVDSDGEEEELVTISIGNAGAIEVLAHSCEFIGLHQGGDCFKFYL